MANVWADALSRGIKAQEWGLGDLACHRLFKCWRTLVVDLSANNQAHKVPQYFSLYLSDKEASGGDALKEVARGPQVCLPTSKHHPSGPGQASKMGKGPDNDHTLLVRSELVSEDHASGSRATKKVHTIRVAPM